ncbi:MAG: hypothetical protein GY920_17840 [Aliivibrio sp.]|nr:hypothetical protein [Aliivibrio sp.]MCP4255860.1 hypothetical protein [Candidatus Scalindua sp.]
MTTSRAAHKCYACPETIEAGASFNKGRRGKKTCLKCHERRINRRMKKENKRLRNLILFLTLISFILFAVDDGYVAFIVLAFIGWVFYVVNYCGKKDGKLKTKV